jgi:hypothetical protein
VRACFTVSIAAPKTRLGGIISILFHEEETPLSGISFPLANDVMTQSRIGL